MLLSDIIYILPLIVPALAAIILMMLITVVRNHLLMAFVTIFSLIMSLLSVFVSYNTQPKQVTDLLIMDGYAYFYIGLIYSATIAVCAFSYGYIKNKKIIREEYYLFLMTTSLGCAVLVSSNHLASFFIGIELLSLSLYVLIAYSGTTYSGTRYNIEAGLKYFVMTAVSVVFLLFGIALTYAATGSMKFPAVSQLGSGSGINNTFLFLAGIGLIIVGVSFKLALVPFHFWIADVFQGTTAPVAGFLGTVSKGAVFAALMRLFVSIDILQNNSLYYVFALTAAASMFFGNITALMQNNIKRILAYSSVAHFGYLLLTVIAGGQAGLAASVFYLTAYFITTLIAFGIISILSGSDSDLEFLGDYKGMAYSHPYLAAGLAGAMLSLAGIPLTAGFIAKFYIITAGAKVKLWTLLIILVINSAISLFYYLRIVVSLYIPQTSLAEPEKMSNQRQVTSSASSTSWVGGAALIVLFLSLLYLGIIPGRFIQMILIFTSHLI